MRKIVRIIFITANNCSICDDIKTSMNDFINQYKYDYDISVINREDKQDNAFEIIKINEELVDFNLPEYPAVYVEYDTGYIKVVMGSSLVTGLNLELSEETS